MWRRSLARSVYVNLVKPVLFRFDAEKVHEVATVVGERLESSERFVRFVLGHNNPPQLKKILGVEFHNPIGLAAGFDYDGHLAQVMQHVGFGFNTVGTVTARPYAGNRYPRLGRLPKSRALLVNKGFKSEGAAAVARRLDAKNLTGHTIGLSVGSSNIPVIDTVAKAIDDYLETFSIFQKRPYVKYFELNISCPNIALTGSFVDPNNFRMLVQAVRSLRIRQPIFVKMPNEIAEEKSEELVRMALSAGIRGFIFSNLVKNRKNEAFDPQEVAHVANMAGNFSGRPAAKNSFALTAHTRQTFGKDVAIISCGGIFTADEARGRFVAGADLVQVISALIFEGPQVVNELVRGMSTEHARASQPSGF